MKWKKARFGFQNIYLSFTLHVQNLKCMKVPPKMVIFSAEKQTCQWCFPLQTRIPSLKYPPCAFQQVAFQALPEFREIIISI